MARVVDSEAGEVVRWLRWLLVHGGRWSLELRLVLRRQLHAAAAVGRERQVFEGPAVVRHSPAPLGSGTGSETDPPEARAGGQSTKRPTPIGSLERTAPCGSSP